MGCLGHWPAEALGGRLVSRQVGLNMSGRVRVQVGIVSWIELFPFQNEVDWPALRGGGYDPLSRRRLEQQTCHTVARASDLSCVPDRYLKPDLPFAPSLARNNSTCSILPSTAISSSLLRIFHSAFSLVL